MGIRGNVSRYTLANANQVRDWRIYADFARFVIAQARSLYAHEDLGFELEQVAYASAAPTIDLCLFIFPWAKFRQPKGANKLHTPLDLYGSIPTLIYVIQGKPHEVNLLDDLIAEPGAFRLFDRGYLDFPNLYKIHHCGAFFIIRAKSNFRFRRIYSQPVDKAKRVQPDQIIKLRGFMLEKIIPSGSEGFVTSPREKETIRFLNQQFPITGIRHCRAFSVPVEDRIILQRDQTAYVRLSFPF